LLLGGDRRHGALPCRPCGVVADDVAHAAQADITDADALAQLGLSSFDAVVIGVAENLEASVLATVLVKRLGVRHIVVKVGSPLHGEILRQVGATRTIDPEMETASRVAQSFAALDVEAYFALAAGFGMARLCGGYSDGGEEPAGAQPDGPSQAYGHCHHAERCRHVEPGRPGSPRRGR
jgi:hypothetical protein